MNDPELAAALVGAFLAGGVCTIAAVYLYARKLFRDRFGKLAAQLTGLDGAAAAQPPTIPPYEPPPTGARPPTIPPYDPPPTGTQTP